MRLGTRIADLEKRLAARRPVGKVYRIAGGTGDDDCTAFLGGLGITLTAGDTIIQRSFYRPGDDGPVCVPEPLTLRGAA